MPWCCAVMAARDAMDRRGSREELSKRGACVLLEILCESKAEEEQGSSMAVYVID